MEEQEGALSVAELAGMIGCRIIAMEPGRACVMGFAPGETESKTIRRWFVMAVPTELDHVSDEEVAQRMVGHVDVVGRDELRVDLGK